MLHYLTKDKHIYSFDAGNSIALSISPGDSVRVETMDCFSNQIQSPEDSLEEISWERINPATGPIYVEGAQKGDALKITVEEIKTGEQAVMLTGKSLGVLGHKLEGMHFKVLPARENEIVFDEHTRLPVEPMIGVIGVAPEGEGVNCGTPDVHGGNMDTSLIREKAVVYLPVWVEGGLLALGDLHAAMGDGEVCVSGAEVAGEVQLKVELIKDLSLPTPLVTDDHILAVIYSQKSLDEAANGTVEIMADLICSRTELTTEDAIMLLSAAGNLRISQVVDPLKTVRFEIPRSILANYNFKL